MRAALSINLVFLTVFGIVSVACSGGDDKPESTLPAATVASTSPAASATVPAGAAATAAPTASGGAISDPCSLITKQEASTAMGEAAQDPVPTSLGSTSVGPGLTVVIAHCEFPSTSEAFYVLIDLWRATGATAALVRQVVEQVICMGKERVTGIGDLACWYDSSHNELQIVKGATFIDIQISPDVSNPGDAVRTLAMRAVGRIP